MHSRDRNKRKYIVTRAGYSKRARLFVSSSSSSCSRGKEREKFTSPDMSGRTIKRQETRLGACVRSYGRDYRRELINFAKEFAREIGTCQRPDGRTGSYLFIRSLARMKEVRGGQRASERASQRACDTTLRAAEGIALRSYGAFARF